MPYASPAATFLETFASNIDPKTRRVIDSDQERAWRTTIRDGLAAGVMSPAVVEAYAGLHLRTETGQPIRPEAHHRLWLELLCDDRIPGLLILAPPEAAKTTWIVSAWAGCRLGFFPQEPIIITSATGPIAKKRTLSLRTQTQSLSWQSTFRNVRRAEGMIWHHEEWAIAPDGIPFSGRIHPSCAAFGVDGSVTGARGRIIIGDDIVTRKNAKTQYQRTEVKEFVHSTLLPRQMSDREDDGHPSGVSRRVFIGTPYNPDDIYQEFRDSGHYVVCRTPLLSDESGITDGLPYYATLEYPDWWTHDMIGEAAPRREMEEQEE